MNSDNITFAYIIRDYTDEYVFTSNKFKNVLKNVILIVSGNYELKLPHYTYKNIKLKDIYTKIGLKAIFDNISTNWVMFMKPEEAFNSSINIPDLEIHNYWVIVEKIINQNVDHNLIYGDIKLFHKDANFDNVPKYSGLVVLNYEILFPIINKTQTDAYMYAMANENLNLKAIMFLAEKNIIKLNIKETFDLYYNENDTSPELLSMIIYIAKEYIMAKKYNYAKNVLEKGLINFPTSPALNSLLSEIYFMQENYKNAEFFIKKCIEMGLKKNFYMSLPFSPAIISFAAYQFLARILDKLNNYDQAKIAYEYAIDTCNNSNKNSIISEYKKYLTKIADREDYTDELSFACQTCGNCCRHFKYVNVTHYDILRIMENKPELKFEDIVDIVDLNSDQIFENHLQTNSDKKRLYRYALKKKKDSTECVFLENNICSINSYKPLGCKIWPFTSKGQDLVTWSQNNRKFIKKFCAFTSIKGSNNEKEVLDLINVNIEETQNSVSLLDKWVDKIDINNIPEEFIEDLKNNYT